VRASLSRVQALAERLSPEGLNLLAARLERDGRKGGRDLAREIRRRIQMMEEAIRKDASLRFFDASFGVRILAGADEVGRGALAGPLVAAAVILRPSMPILGLDDSKRLSALRRERLVPEILAACRAWCIAFVTPQAIDREGMGVANRRLLASAAMGLPLTPDLLLVDAMALPDYPHPQRGIIKADSRSQTVAAASVLAKVVRDRMMAALAEEDFPGYGFESHVGYASQGHVRSLRAMGITALHRRSFLGFLDEGEGG